MPRGLENPVIEARFLWFCTCYKTLSPPNQIRLGNIPQVVVGPDGDEYPLSRH
jgi:hypothetical protein